MPHQVTGPPAPATSNFSNTDSPAARHAWLESVGAQLTEDGAWRVSAAQLDAAYAQGASEHKRRFITRYAPLPSGGPAVLELLWWSPGEAQRFSGGPGKPLVSLSEGTRRMDASLTSDIIGSTARTALESSFLAATQMADAGEPNHAFYHMLRPGPTPGGGAPFVTLERWSCTPVDLVTDGGGVRRAVLREVVPEGDASAEHDRLLARALFSDACSETLLTALALAPEGGAAMILHQNTASACWHGYLRRAAPSDWLQTRLGPGAAAAAAEVLSCACASLRWRQRQQPAPGSYAALTAAREQGGCGSDCAGGADISGSGGSSAGGSCRSAAGAGGERWLETSMTRAMDPVTHAWVLLVSEVDVTDVVVSEEARAEAAEMSAQLEAKRRLLNSMMPPHVVPRVLAGEKDIAQAHDDITVLFVDVCGFTSMCSSMEPVAVMRLINSLFSAFDELLEDFGVHRAEIIGDGYMCVTGHDEQANAALRMFAFALALLRRVEAMAAGAPAGSAEKALTIRVGMASGPAVSGVVGRRPPRWTFLGDTVNTASRIQSSSAAGAVCLSVACWRVVVRQRDAAEAAAGSDAHLCGWRADALQPERRVVDVKGKGAMAVVLLRPPPLPASPPADAAALECTPETLAALEWASVRDARCSVPCVPESHALSESPPCEVLRGSRISSGGWAAVPHARASAGPKHIRRWSSTQEYK